MIAAEVKGIERSASAQKAQIPSCRLVGGSRGRLRKIEGCARQSKACGPICYARLRSLEITVFSDELEDIW